ncbi:hypothetical protein GCM10025734_58140 [Kitasatospora paranensis]
MDYQVLLQDAMEQARRMPARGRVADYIPALAEADPLAFGMAIATVDGGVFGAGDWQRPFSIQSVSKLFTLALALAEGGEGLWRGWAGSRPAIRSTRSSSWSRSRASRATPSSTRVPWW